MRHFHIVHNIVFFKFLLVITVVPRESEKKNMLMHFSVRGGGGGRGDHGVSVFWAM